MRRFMNLGVLLILVLIQFFWSGSYVAMKLSMEDLPIGLIVTLRFGLATALFFFFGGFKGGLSFKWKDWALIVGLSMAAFVISPYCQLKSLGLTQVMDVSILISLEPLVTALAASFFLKEKLGWDLIFVFAIATVGVLILSGVSLGSLSSGPVTSLRLLGNAIFLMAIACEASWSIGGRYLTQRNFSPIQLVAWMHLIGFLANLGVHHADFRAVAWDKVSFSAWTGVVFLAVCCSFIGYTAWYILVKKILVSYLALSLFFQPIFGSFLGFVLMGERFDSQLLLGGGLIVLTLLGWTLLQLRRPSNDLSAQNV